MNLPVYTTDTLLLDMYQGASVLEAFVHTILFHRMAHRMARPVEVGNPIYESLVYVHGGDPAVSERVTECIRETMETLSERMTGTVVVVFYHVRPGSRWFQTEQRIAIEQWRIPVQWYALYDRSLTHAIKEERVLAVYQGLLQLLLGATLDPVPFAFGNDTLPFDIMDADKTNRFMDLFQFIASGPPKMGFF